MTTITLRIPDDLASHLAAEVAMSGFDNATDYILALIRQSQQSRGKAALEAKLEAGVDSLDRGEGKAATAADWERLRQRARQGEGGNREPRCRTSRL
jgi:Arc/MetJ-type ribon-helix-helix transcriptional regulator